MLMINKPLTVEQRLTKGVVAIMGNAKYLRLASVMMIGKREVCDKTKTAKTNGRDEWYGREFVDKLSDAELRFLILHEVYHKLYRHLVTWKHLHDINHKVANMACDYVINLKLHDDNREDKFAVMPKGGLVDERFRGMHAGQVFKILMDEGQGEGEGDGEGGNEDGEGESGQGGGSSGGMDEHDWDGAEELSQDEKKSLERELDEAIRQGALLAGKAGCGADRDFDDLLQAKIDWREELREFVSEVCVGKDYSTWRRPNRRYISNDIYMPSAISESMGELVIACDTSGSIGQMELRQFLSEIKVICDSVRPDAVRLLYWDTTVCGDEKYEADQLESLITSTKPKGGGGTDIDCVSQYMQEKGINPQAVIVFTDGYLSGSWGKWSVPLMWCFLNNRQANPPVGKRLFVDLD
jgi:predicted metal-dependent peptidase